MKAIRKIVFVMTMMTLLMTANVFAGQEVDLSNQTTQGTVDTTKPLVALGANLTAEQKSTVLNHMGISEADLENYNVIYITNDMEHQYLDSYVDPSIIGTKSLSSVMVTPKEAGHGVLVETVNITYCTTGMYRNALLTAGVSDADILVVGPTQISGTAALIGAVKGYELLSGEKITDETLDTALNEMIATGEIADALNDADSEDVEALIAFVKAKLAAGELNSEDDIRSAISEGENKFGVALTDSEKNQIVDVMNKIDALGLDPNVLVSQAEDLYKQFGADFLNHLDGKTIAKTGIASFFSGLGNSIKNFFSGLF